MTLLNWFYVSLLSTGLVWADRTLQWAGMDWLVRDSAGKKENPGPNVFSAGGKNVYLDSTDGLHLTIQNSGNIWRSTEVILSKEMGYGIYEFEMGSPVDALHPSLVLALSILRDSKSSMSVEFSRLGNNSKDTTLPNARYCVTECNEWRYPAKLTFSVHTIHWHTKYTSFISRDKNGTQLNFFNFTSTDQTPVPQPPGLQVHIGFFLYQGITSLSTSAVIDLTIKNFTFTKFSM